MYTSNNSVIWKHKNKNTIGVSGFALVIGLCLSGSSLSLLTFNTQAFAAEFGQSGKGGKQGTLPNDLLQADGQLSHDGIGGNGGGTKAGTGGGVGSYSITGEPIIGENGKMLKMIFITKQI